MTTTVLFETRSTKLTSRLLFVHPGRAQLLSAFALRGDVTLQKVLTQDGMAFPGEGGATPAVFQSEDVGTVLSGKAKTRVLTTPGIYQLVLSNPEDMGVAHIQSKELPLGDVSLIPAGLIF